MYRLARSLFLAATLILLLSAPASSASLTVTYDIQAGTFEDVSTGTFYEVVGGTATLRLFDNVPPTSGNLHWTAGSLLNFSVSVFTTNLSNFVTAFGIPSARPFANVSGSFNTASGTGTATATGSWFTSPLGAGQFRAFFNGGTGSLTANSITGFVGGGAVQTFSITNLSAQEVSRVVPEPRTGLLFAASAAAVALAFGHAARRRAR